MFAAFLFAVLLVVVAADYQISISGAYCSNSMTTLPGVASSVTDCGNKCTAASNTYKYFNWVPSSGQCLCSTSNSPQVNNPNTNCYAIPPACPAYTQCWSSSYCGPNSAVVTQSGVFTCAADCATKCASNASYKFFNYVAAPNNGSGQCQCLTGCGQLIASASNVNAYSLGCQSCTHGRRALRA